MKAYLILNPTAGRGSHGIEKSVGNAFRRHGIDCRVWITKKAGDAVDLAGRAVQEDADLVIAAGGDGTLNEVVNGLGDAHIPLGIIPLGMVNVLARELRIPLSTHEAINNIVNGNVQLIDVCNANDRRFVLMAGFGFDAEVVANVLQPMKDWIGPSAYVLEGLKTLAKYKATKITLRMPEETYSAKAFLVIVANVSTYTYNLTITPHACPDNGLLDICVFERPVMDRIGFIRQVADVFLNRHLYHRAVRYFRTESVEISSSPAVFMQLDGDAYGTTPVTISIMPRVLPVIVPGKPG